MSTEVLHKIGLPDPEIKVYLALVELGKTTTGPLIKKSKIPSSKIYMILDRLVEKGLVSYIVRSNKKYYDATNPNNLVDFFEDKISDLVDTKSELISCVNALNKLKNRNKEKVTIRFYEGIKGIRSFQEMIFRNFKPKDKVFVVGTSYVNNPSLTGYFTDFHRRRINKAVAYYVIKHESGREHRFVEDLKSTEVRYLPNFIQMPTIFQIYRDYVAIMMYKPMIFCLSIKNKEVAKSFRSYFDAIWSISRR